MFLSGFIPGASGAEESNIVWASCQKNWGHADRGTLFLSVRLKHTPAGAIAGALFLGAS
jgi:hypothetical protein